MQLNKKKNSFEDSLEWRGGSGLKIMDLWQQILVVVIYVSSRSCFQVSCSSLFNIFPIVESAHDIAKEN